jgi:hypothetical protein
MTTEDLVRDLLHDPRWSLPARPDMQARVRRAARRQRLAAASIGAAAVAFVTIAAVIPVVLLGSLAPRGNAGPGPGAMPIADSLATPAVGAVGFAAAVYPAAVKVKAKTGVTLLCPDPAGLQAFGPGLAGAPLMVLRKLAQVQVAATLKGAGLVAPPVAGPGRGPAVVGGQVLASTLRLSDRAFWPQAVRWSMVIVRAARVPVIYSGPLGTYRKVHGPPDAAGVVSVSCGRRVAMDTWVIVSGQPSSPATEAETFFVNRRGHVLLYKASAA